MRESPKGMAAASHADSRGVDSRRPLQTKKPYFAERRMRLFSLI